MVEVEEWAPRWERKIEEIQVKLGRKLTQTEFYWLYNRFQPDAPDWEVMQREYFKIPAEETVETTEGSWHLIEKITVEVVDGVVRIVETAYDSYIAKEYAAIYERVETDIRRYGTITKDTKARIDSLILYAEANRAEVTEYGRAYIDELIKFLGQGIRTVEGTIIDEIRHTIADVYTSVIDAGAEFMGRIIAGAITRSMGDLMEKSIIGDVGKGTVLGERMAAQAPEVVKPGSPAIRVRFEDATRSVQLELKTAIDKQIAELEKTHSPISPEDALKVGGGIAVGALAASVGLTAASTAIEAASLGQLEVPGSFLLQLGAAYGLYKFIGTPVITAYDVGVARGINYYYNKIFTPNIPGPTDLVRFELREVWRPEFRPELLMPPPTDRFIKLMAYQGYDRSFAEDYWAAHWELPSPLQGYTMYHRLRPGKPGIKKAFTVEDLQALLRRLDILPAYHDQLIDIAYLPLTRVDVRRMYKSGVLDRAGVKSAFMDLGYDEVKAELLTEFTVRWTEEGLEREAGGGTVKALLKEGFRTEVEGRVLLEDLGYGGEDLEKQIKIARLMYEYDYKSDLRSLTLDRFVAGEIDEATAVVQLSEIMPAAERVAALIDRYRLRVKAPKK